MCDQYDNRGCEIVDERDNIIASLEDRVDELEEKLTMVITTKGGYY